MKGTSNKIQRQENQYIHDLETKFHYESIRKEAILSKHVSKSKEKKVLEYLNYCSYKSTNCFLKVIERKKAKTSDRGTNGTNLTCVSALGEDLTFFNLSKKKKKDTLLYLQSFQEDGKIKEDKT